MVVLGAVAVAALALDQAGIPSGWWTNVHGNQRHIRLVLAFIAIVGFVTIVESLSEEFADHRQEKSLARQVKIEQLLGAAVANIVDRSTRRHYEDLKQLGKELREASASVELADRFDKHLAHELLSITMIDAYFYQIRKNLRRVRLVLRGRFSMTVERPDYVKPQYKLGQDSVGVAAANQDFAWEAIEAPSCRVVITNRPLFSGGTLIGVLSIVGVPGNKAMEDTLLDREITKLIAGWSTALSQLESTSR
jgi:hypothetical protein